MLLETQHHDRTPTTFRLATPYIQSSSQFVRGTIRFGNRPAKFPSSFGQQLLHASALSKHGLFADALQPGLEWVCRGSDLECLVDSEQLWPQLHHDAVSSGAVPHVVDELSEYVVRHDGGWKA